MMDKDAKRGPGRPPKHGEAMTGAERQHLYARSRQAERLRRAGQGVGTEPEIAQSAELQGKP